MPAGKPISPQRNLHADPTRYHPFDIGTHRLAVAHDVPAPIQPLEADSGPSIQAALALLRLGSGTAQAGGSSVAHTAAKDWARLKERMHYIFALFQAFHTDPQVFTIPYTAGQLAALAAGQRPAGTL